MNVKPINKNILIQLAETTKTSAGGIILQREKREQTGIVLAVGSQVKYIEVGMKIAFQLGDFKPLGDETAIVLEDHVVGYFYNE